MKKILLFSIVVLAAIACERKDPNDDYGENVEPFISVSQSSFPVLNTSTDTTILVTSNVWWNVTVGYPAGTNEWITGVTPKTTNATQELGFTFVPNLSGSNRTAIVTVSPKVEGATDPCVFTLVQGPSGPFIEVSSDNITGDDLLLGVVADDCLLEIFTNYDWSIDNSNAAWLTFEPSSGSGNAESAEEITCHFPSNRSGQIKTGSITITAGSETKTITVSQDKDFSASALTITNNETLIAGWTPVVGVSSYTMVIEDGSGNTVTDINLPSNTTNYDLGAYFRQNPFAQSINVSIQAGSADPEISSTSNVVSTHPYFDSGSGDGNATGNELLISSKRHLANIVFSGLLDKYYKQTAALDMSGVSHTPIGSAPVNSRFTGSYDGASNVISNLSATIDDSGTSFWGLFGVVAEGAVIKNIQFRNCSLNLVKAGTTEPLGFGFAAGANYGGTIDNVHTVDCTIAMNTLAGAIGAGSIAGSNMSGVTVPGTIKNCTTTRGEIATTSMANSPLVYVIGGIAGIGVPGSKLENCGNISTTIKSRGATTGGVAGQNCSVVNCYNKANIEGASNTAGILGKFDANGIGEITNCYNTGNITYRYGNAAYYHGGIVATINTSGSFTITRCFNSGTIEAKILDRPNIYGGIAARSANTSPESTVVIKDCYNTGSVISPCTDNTKTSNSGGIIGDVVSSYTTIVNCYNVGNVTVGANATATGTRAGIVGNRTSDNSTLTGLYYLTGNCDNRMAIGGNTPSGTKVTDVPPTGKSASDLKNPATYDPSWDFSNVWEAPSAGYDYPQLKGLPYQ